MYQFIRLVILFGPMPIFSSCQDKSIQQDLTTPEDQTTIEFGTICGWCAGGSVLIVTPDSVKFTAEIPCGENHDTVSVNDRLPAGEWKTIEGSYDYSRFGTLEYNSCHYCGDGCDKWIKITKNDQSHEIRYAPTDTIEGMEDLRMLLRNLRNQFSSN